MITSVSPKMIYRVEAWHYRETEASHPSPPYVEQHIGVFPDRCRAHIFAHHMAMNHGRSGTDYVRYVVIDTRKRSEDKRLVEVCG